MEKKREQELSVSCGDMIFMGTSVLLIPISKIYEKNWE